MSKGKGGGGSVSQPSAPTIIMPTSQAGAREQSPDELRLLQSQNEALQSGMAISAEQEARSRQLHDIWKETYLPVETGMIHGDASEENGYMDSESINRAMDSRNYPARRTSGSGGYGGRSGCSGKSGCSGSKGLVNPNSNTQQRNVSNDGTKLSGLQFLADRRGIGAGSNAYNQGRSAYGNYYNAGSRGKGA